MTGSAPSLTYVGGPTAVLDWGGLRILTDPTFDAAPTAYELPGYTLRKTQGPAVAADALGAVDVVLLSHEHHVDNLDRAGRALLPSAGRVLTTTDGAAALGDDTVGLRPWESAEIAAAGATLQVTATPARHGPADGDRGPVIGFALAFDQAPDEVVYFSGDTVWYEGVRKVAERFSVRIALLCFGAARVSIAGPQPLTLTAQEGVEVARVMPSALIVPVHFEGWEHFSENRGDVEHAFAAAGMSERLRWPVAGEPIAIA
jgi:L-ascorbate metabolism protein UlaG (beta-lactamase superfamily)